MEKKAGRHGPVSYSNVSATVTRPSHNQSFTIALAIADDFRLVGDVTSAIYVRYTYTIHMHQ